jgi:hypothetical protein
MTREFAESWVVAGLPRAPAAPTLDVVSRRARTIITGLGVLALVVLGGGLAMAANLGILRDANHHRVGELSVDDLVTSPSAVRPDATSTTPTSPTTGTLESTVPPGGSGPTSSEATTPAAPTTAPGATTSTAAPTSTTAVAGDEHGDEHGDGEHAGDEGSDDDSPSDGDLDDD